VAEKNDPSRHSHPRICVESSRPTLSTRARRDSRVAAFAGEQV